MANAELYSVDVSWLVVHSKKFLRFACHESSTVVLTTFIIENVKNSDVSTKMSHMYSLCSINGVQGENNQKYHIKQPNGCLRDSQYHYGLTTNITKCCTQQSAHSCQVSNSSLDIQQSMPSLSGSFLRSSTNTLEFYNGTFVLGVSKIL